MEEYKAIMEILVNIEKKVDNLSTHSEYTKLEVKENKAEIKENKKFIIDHEKRINILEMSMQAFRDVVWEVLRGPLALTGVIIVIAIGVVGTVIYLK